MVGKATHSKELPSSGHDAKHGVVATDARANLIVVLL